MKRSELFDRLAQLGTEFSPALVEQTNALFAPLAPAPDEGRTTRDMAYGPHARHRFNLFRPVADDPAPCLLFLHGGGFVMGDKGPPGAPFYNNVGAWAQREGFVCATMNYRLAPEVRWPAGREDTIAMILHLSANAAELGIDPDRIVLMGHSAGATHVADVVAAPGEARGHFAGAIMSSGFYDLGNAVRDAFKPQYYGPDEGGWAAMSSLPGLLKTDARCLFAVGELDLAECQQQILTLVQRWLAERGGWPVVNVQARHNHISGAQQIGSALDSFGPVVREFILQC